METIHIAERLFENLFLPLQTVETVDESVQERQRNMFAAASNAGRRNGLVRTDQIAGGKPFVL